MVWPVLPAIFAHRLGGAYGPDSWSAALRRSLEQPLDGLETDCCLTADGDLVLLHDPLLELGTTLSGWAHERTAAQILTGRLRHRDGSLGTIAPGPVQAIVSNSPSEERPLLLEQLLELAPPER
jgi:glycerophosphoryl diester phosphodiesterase